MDEMGDRLPAHGEVGRSWSRVRAPRRTYQAQLAGLSTDNAIGGFIVAEIERLAPRAEAGVFRKLDDRWVHIGSLARRIAMTPRAASAAERLVGTQCVAAVDSAEQDVLDIIGGCPAGVVAALRSNGRLQGLVLIGGTRTSMGKLVIEDSLEDLADQAGDRLLTLQLLERVEVLEDKCVRLTSFQAFAHDAKKHVAWLRELAGRLSRPEAQPEAVQPNAAAIAELAEDLGSRLRSLFADETQDLHSAVVPLVALVSAAVRSIERARDAHGRVVVGDFVATRERLVPTILGTVIENLLDNAIEASDADQIVRLTTSVSSDNLMLSIRDAGAGMSPAVRHQAFLSGFSTKGPRYRGAGLATSQQIVQHLGGKVELASVEGSGTCATVYLPLPPAPTKSADPPRPPKTTRPGRGGRPAHYLDSKDS